MPLPPATTPAALREDDSSSRRERISIVVISFNRAGPLLDALRSVARLEHRGDFDVELVVVDNASTDGTADVVQAFACDCPFPVRYIREENPGIPFARNRGVRESQGDWVCFFDDDQTAEPDWLWQLYNEATQQQLSCVGGARDLVIENHQRPPAAPFCRGLLGEWPPSLPACDYHRRWLPNTGNVLIHRSVFLEIGGFDEGSLEGGDDTDFFHRLLKSGRRARFTPASLVHHHIPADRVSSKYLQWAAKRHGVVIARRDRSDGKTYFAYCFVARLAQALLIHCPHWGALMLIGRSDLSLGPLCKLRRFEGFTRFALLLATPKSWRRCDVTAQVQHRDSATVACRDRQPTQHPTGVGESRAAS